jgi:hypothetical protein
LVHFARGLQKIFNAFIISIPKLMNVGAVLFLLLFIYAVMGSQLLGKVQHYNEHDHHANFQSFFMSMGEEEEFQSASKVVIY